MSIAYISIEATKWAWNESASTGQAKLVLLAIAAHCNADGWCWPKLETIEEAVSASRPTILQALGKLEELGEVVIERGGKGPGSTHKYYLAGFVERVKKGKEEAVKGKIEPDLRVKPIERSKSSQLQAGQEVTEENRGDSETQNKKYLEEIEEVPTPSVREDPKQVFRECKRYYRRNVGKSPGSIPPSRGQEWLNWIEKKTGEVAFQAFKYWVDDNKDWLKRERPKWPMAIFMKNIGEQIEAYEDIAAGERESEDGNSEIPLIVNEE